MSARKTIKYFDLFAGIGGFNQAIQELSLPNTKFKHIGYCEIDKQARRLYDEVHKQAINGFCIPDALDIYTKKNIEGDKVPDFDMLLAGFPCQSFSNVGYRKGLNDDRGKLFYTILDVLDTYNPNFFVLENVQKLKTIQGGGLLEEMKVALQNIGHGYHLHVWDLRALNYGV
ncbi:MAG: DNA cytosine methyltransferase, partial [Saprospiraceae bacterium]